MKMAQADSSGCSSPQNLGTFAPGEYDIWVDRNDDDVLDEGSEPVDTFGLNRGFFVIPEYVIGTILGLVGCFAAFGVFRLSKRER